MPSLVKCPTSGLYTLRSAFVFLSMHNLFKEFQGKSKMQKCLCATNLLEKSLNSLFEIIYQIRVKRNKLLNSQFVTYFVTVLIFFLYSYDFLKLY